MDPDDKKYAPKEQEFLNGLIKSYKGHTENKWRDVSKIGLFVLKI